MNKDEISDFFDLCKDYKDRRKIEIFRYIEAISQESKVDKMTIFLDMLELGCEVASSLVRNDDLLIKKEGERSVSIYTHTRSKEDEQLNKSDVH